eukprot:GHVU01125181.1.p2 GENE.GHVU01125181.1~~GHVU01125181.1.p2  ORF type:complete len:124 (+),score=16.24 GHVU01125181.1:288-659(+)
MQYQPSLVIQWFNSFISVLQYGAMLAMLFGPTSVLQSSLGTALVGSGSNVSRIAQSLEENKVAIIAGLFFGGNLIKGVISSSSAFEMFLGNTPMWSAVLEGRMPSMQEMEDRLREAGYTFPHR